MTHPTDAELEAVAQRLELVAPTDVEVVDMLRACKGRVRVKSPEAVERFDLEQPTHPMGSAWMEPAPRYGDWVRYSDYAALSAALESERAEAARRKWEDWRQIATLARASAEAAEDKLAEMTRRRDEWRKKAEGYDAVRLALREKVGTPPPISLSRLMWAGVAADEKKRADDAEAALAKADELAREAYFVSGAEPLGHYANDQVSMDKSVVTDITTALTAYRQARDATR